MDVWLSACVFILFSLSLSVSPEIKNTLYCLWVPLSWSWREPTYLVATVRAEMCTYLWNEHIGSIWKSWIQRCYFLERSIQTTGGKNDSGKKTQSSMIAQVKHGHVSLFYYSFIIIFFFCFQDKWKKYLKKSIKIWVGGWLIQLSVCCANTRT